MELQVDDICKIIEKCSEHGVTSIKLGETTIEFGSSTAHYPKAMGKFSIPSSPEEIEEDQAEVFKESERIRVAEKISNLLIEDPEKYEEMLASGELDELVEKHNLNEGDEYEQESDD